ncbi:MAG: 50S ribosomal protein L5 [Thermodesulfobacteriota bacterium]
MEPRLKTVYKEIVVPELMKKFSYKNVMQVPKVERIVLNIGLGRLSEAGRNTKVIEEAVEELTQIVGQKPVITKAKKSIAGFKLREDLPIGCMVTLRGTMMYEFLDRLVNLALPRVRDFKGVNPKSFDGRGNYTLGIKEQIIFPEIDYSKVQNVKGLNVSIVTTSGTDQEALEMLELFGMPFSKN